MSIPLPSYASIIHISINPHLLIEISDSQGSILGADLRSGDLSNAYLTGANLTGVNFDQVNLSGTYLHGADLTEADFRKAKCLTSEQVKQAKNWKQARYSEDLSRELDLPSESTTEKDK